MLKKNGGITLIALVVTIIVLLILAGITIAMLTGDNGIITRTNDSKMSQIEGQVQEEVKLAMQSAKIEAMKRSVETSTGFLASENPTVVIDVLDDDLVTGYAFANKVQSDDTYIKITFTSTDYAAATNYDGAKIEAFIKMTGNKFELVSMKATRSGGNDDTKNRYPIGQASDYSTANGLFTPTV